MIPMEARLTSSATGSDRPKVRLVAERPVIPTPAATLSIRPGTGSESTTQTETADQPSTPSSEHYHDQMLATMTTLAMILNARALALLAVVGAFVLALIAVIDPTILKLAVSGMFDLAVLIPTVALYFKRG